MKSYAEMKPTPSKKAEAKRLHILNTSSNLILNKGFTGVGLLEILKNCQIPKGSFYSYFESKEVFGCELVQFYLDNYQVRLDEVWNTEQSAKQKLMMYFKLWIDDPETKQGWADTCLIVKLAAEVADLSEDMRLIMANGVDQVIQRVADLIALNEDDSVLNSADALSLAETIFQMWLGAALLSKLHKDKAPLYKALKATESLLNI